MELSERMESVRAINPSYFDFLVQWQGIVIYLIFGAIGIGVILWAQYKIRVFRLGTFKDKHDYISENETDRLFLVHLSFAIALLFFVNYLEWETVAKSVVWFLVRAFIGIAVAILHAYVAKLLLKYFWPKQMHKRLRKLRYTPRINPANGSIMKLLSEEEEDVYLDEGKSAEENLFSVDYDVWIDEKTGDTHIEKYEGRLLAEECDRCGFQTLKLEKEEIVQAATEHEDGELQKEFKCVYCNRVKRRKMKISRTMDRDSSSARIIENPLADQERIVLIKIGIKSISFNLLSYEFKNIREVLRSEDLANQGYGVEEVKVEIITNEDEELKFDFESLEETISFLKQFDIHKVRE